MIYLSTMFTYYHVVDGRQSERGGLLFDTNIILNFEVDEAHKHHYRQEG